jgi:hypothetical protein
MARVDAQHLDPRAALGECAETLAGDAVLSSQIAS